jgi:hypothetical protein
MQEQQSPTKSQVCGSEGAVKLENRLFVIRVGFWVLGTVLAVLQASAYRYWVSGDGISYLDLSDAVSSGLGWHRLINGTWSPLYPFLLGLSELVQQDRYNEIVSGHVLNVVLFLGAFAAFEYLMCSVSPRQSVPDDSAEHCLLPRWAYFVIGYSVFLWASLVEDTLQYLRADTLMSMFLFLAMGLLIRIQENSASWSRYLALGIVLGLGYLSKQPMLPIGILIILSSILAAKNRVHALPKVLLAALLLFVIGGAYFVPLSRARGYLTFGEAGTYNYLVYVDHESEPVYMMDPGAGAGKFLHMPIKIFDTPPTYSFSSGQTAVTHYLRYDPSYWVQGARARFSASGQVRAIFLNLNPYIDAIAKTGGLTAGFIVLCFLSGDHRRVLVGISRKWPLWVIGLCGLGMYLAVHVEDRYIGPYFLLLWLGLLSGIQLPRILLNRAGVGVALGIAVSILVPLIGTASYDVVHRRNATTDFSAETAKQLAKLGVHPADRVARISPWYTDYAWAHMLRVSVIAEVDPRHAAEFWECGPAVQAQVLKRMCDAGAKVVVAHISGDSAPPNWHRLGNTEQWIHWLD